MRRTILEVIERLPVDWYPDFPKIWMRGGRMAWTEESPFQALALTGGGYRGLFTARALQEMEDHIGEPIGRRFDLSYGTSIGGIIALAVAFEVPMQKVVEAFEKAGEKIFPPREKPTGSWGKSKDIFDHRSKPRYGVSSFSVQ